ncbi:MAG: GNAT family N-acetyltransferase [Aristaeellaceae bacterium]
MWDTSVEKVHLRMELDSLEQLPQHPLPEKYGFRFYCPGDEIHWARIETSAGEFSRIEDGLRRFERDFPDKQPLPERMMFLTDGGVPFATVTAWFEPDGAGLLHYVAIDAAHQGQGLSRALTGLGMNRLRALGHRSARLDTQTYSWVAIKVYHEFGFRPVIHGEDERRGWRIVSEKTGIDFGLND